MTLKKKKKIQTILSGALLECQTVWIQIRTDVLSVLIRVQIVADDRRKEFSKPCSRQALFCEMNIKINSKKKNCDGFQIN